MPPDPAVAASAPMSAPVDRLRQAREAEESQECLAPVRHRHERDVDGQQKQEHHRQHRPCEVLEHALDGAAEGQDQDDEDDEAGGDPALQRLIGRARHASHPCTEERRRGAAGKRRPPELEEPHEGVERRPELRARLEAHDAAVDRLAGVERVSDRLEVEDDLQDDGDGGDEKDRRRVFDRRGRSDQPLAAADGRRGHDGAGPDDLEEIARVERWRRRAGRQHPSAEARRGWLATDLRSSRGTPGSACADDITARSSPQGREGGWVTVRLSLFNRRERRGRRDKLG